MREYTERAEMLSESRWLNKGCKGKRKNIIGWENEEERKRKKKGELEREVVV